MKKKILALAVGSLVLSMSASAEDKGWSWLAGLDDDYVMEPTVSLVFGSMSPDDGDSGSVTGVELSFNCPLLQPPTNKIRQQLSVVQYDEAGVEISSIELNPHYVVEVSPGLSIGGGPGLGYVSVDSAGAEDSVLAVQMGASVHYQVAESLFLGADARYQMTDSEDSGVLSDGVDNWRVALKAGFSF